MIIVAVVAMAAKFIMDLGLPFLVRVHDTRCATIACSSLTLPFVAIDGALLQLINLYYVRPVSYLMSKGAIADGKKVVHIKYCIP